MDCTANEQDQHMDCGRRRLIFATAGVGGIAGAAAVLPVLATFTPSERALTAGAPVEVDISKIAPGQIAITEWRGKPVWILHRDQQMLDSLLKVAPKLADPKSQQKMQPEYAKNEHRSIKPEFFVAIGICTHLGCSPKNHFAQGDPELGADWQGGFLCPCHASKFDLAGRVFKDMPAPTNLEVPPYTFLSDSKLLIGSDTKEA